VCHRLQAVREPRKTRLASKLWDTSATDSSWNRAMPFNARRLPSLRRRLHKPPARHQYFAGFGTLGVAVA
jgi:hypothetical protein